MTGVERLQEMVTGQEDAALKQVVDYLCTRNDLSNRYLNPEKNISSMVSYIKDKARAITKNGWNFLKVISLGTKIQKTADEFIKKLEEFISQKLKDAV